MTMSASDQNSSDQQPNRTNPQSPVPFWGAAITSPAAWYRLLVPTIAGLALDLYTKSYVVQHLKGHDRVTVWPGVLEFVYTENRGAVFGMGQGHVLLFILFSIVALGVIGFVFACSRPGQWVQQIALGLITAGALGNLYDRMMFGQVRDFILMLERFWPFIFNVADVLLCIGVPLLMICWIRQGEVAAQSDNNA